MIAFLERTIEELDLSVRSYNCLKRAGINTVYDLTEKSEAEMMKVRNLGHVRVLKKLNQTCRLRPWVKTINRGRNTYYRKLGH